MKRFVCLLAMLPLLAGCAVQETFETVADELVQRVMASPRQITVSLPDDAVAPVLENPGEQIYLCSDYEIVMETRNAGDLTDTVAGISGYAPEELTILETRQTDVTRYEFVWVSAGEKGDRLGRAVVLDDGAYHYCMSVLRDAEEGTSQITWDDVFASFQLL